MHRLTFLAAAALGAATSAWAAEPADTFLGKSADQWQRELNADSAARRHLAAWALSQSPGMPTNVLMAAARHDDPVVRYWAVQGTRSDANAERLMPLLADKSSAVRVAAAEVVARGSQPDAGLKVLVESLSDPQEAVRIQAIASLERLGEKAASRRAAIEKATADSSEYVKRISARMLARLK